MSISGETILRLEHKLDLIIGYLSGKIPHQAPPKDMPKLIPGMGGLTEGTCPITNTPIYYLIDPKSGQVRRSDGLSSGIVETKPIMQTPAIGSKSVILTGNFGDSKGDQNES